MSLLLFEITDYSIIVYEDMEYNNIVAFLSKIIKKRVKNYHKSLIIDRKKNRRVFIPSLSCTFSEVFELYLDFSHLLIIVDDCLPSATRQVFCIDELMLDYDT
jgi:hypothetical protein